MWFWRDDNFRSMLEVEATLRGDPRFALYCDYLVLREKGLRKQALDRLEQFLQRAIVLPLQERCEMVDRLMMLAHAQRSANELLPFPLCKRLVDPTLDQWVASDPRSPVPLRWRGGLDDLRTAAMLDPREMIARKMLIARLLGQLDNAIHELPNGYGYIGDPDEDLRLLSEADERARELEDAARLAKVQEGIRYLRSVVEAYVAFRRSRAEGSFRDWARQTGFPMQHRWSHIPYSR